MKLLIDIPEEYYKTIKETKKEVVPIGWASIKDGIKYEGEALREWILCSERLPEEGPKAYFVTIDYGNGRFCTTTRIFLDKKSLWLVYETDEHVIAWMPIPGPYRKDGDEE